MISCDLLRSLQSKAVALMCQLVLGLLEHAYSEPNTSYERSFSEQAPLERGARGEPGRKRLQKRGLTVAAQSEPCCLQALLGRRMSGDARHFGFTTTFSTAPVLQGDLRQSCIWRQFSCCLEKHRKFPHTQNRSAPISIGLWHSRPYNLRLSLAARMIKIATRSHPYIELAGSVEAVQAMEKMPQSLVASHHSTCVESTSSFTCCTGDDLVDCYFSFLNPSA